jgi:hypothetical protein
LLIGAMLVVSAVLTAGGLPLQRACLRLTIVNSGSLVLLELEVNCLPAWRPNWNRGSPTGNLLSLFVYVWAALY